MIHVTHPVPGDGTLDDLSTVTCWTWKCTCGATSLDAFANLGDLRWDAEKHEKANNPW